MDAMVDISPSILYDEHGRRRSDADVRAEVGHIWLRIARMQEAVAQLPRTEPPSCPPVAFVSYKWGTMSEDAWAHDLARFIESIGWTVMLDAHRDPVEALSVEEFVVRMS